MTYLNLKAVETVADYPGYKVVRREKTKGTFINGQYHGIEFTEIIAGERLGLAKNGYYAEYYPGSVVSYAMETGEDPIGALKRAQERGHELHWINGCATVITAHHRDQETLTLVEVGMIVRFEGLLFTIQKAPNNNLTLVPYVV